MDSLRVELNGAVATLRLNRPDQRNALDEALIAAIPAALDALPATVRVVVLSGEGTAFCAGADAQWMQRSRGFSEAENLRDAAAVGAMLRAVDEHPRPVIARVHGAAMGGGVGLVAACDLAVAAEGAQFGFPEVRLGLIPAVISPFVLPVIGERAARRYFLTGERFGAQEARTLGLVHEVVAPDALDARVDALVGELLQGGAAALTAAKKLIRDVSRLPRDQALGHSIRVLAQLRVGWEAQEGLAAFLERRKPRWP